MKEGSSSASNAGNSMALAERPKPPPTAAGAAPSCVAALFQLFARRKLSSSSSKKTKLLPPARAPKKPPTRLGGGGGGERPVTKRRPLLIEGNDPGDYPRGKREGNADVSLSPHRRAETGGEMCAPGVVARLMGLSSMPAVACRTPGMAKDSAELSDHRNEHPPDLSDARHRAQPLRQKHQGPEWVTDSRDGRHANASQFSREARPSWPNRRTQKLASPVKSPRSISSRSKVRLIEAAARVLEPGLPSRNRRLARHHARLEYLCDNGSVSSAAVLLNMCDNLSRDLGHAAAPRLIARNVEAAPLQNSLSSHEKKATARRPNTVGSSQMQHDGNDQGSPVSSTEKGTPTSLVSQDKNNVNKIVGAITELKQDARKTPHRSVCRDNVASPIPLKANSLKQNALPVACRAAEAGYKVQRQQQDVVKDFVSLNKDLNSRSRTSLRSKKKLPDTVCMTSISPENKNPRTKGRQTDDLHSGSMSSIQLKVSTPRAMRKGMILAKGAGLVSEKPSCTSLGRARRDLQRRVDLHDTARSNNLGIVSFTFSSPMKNVLPTSSLGNDISEIGAATTVSRGDAPRPKTRCDKDRRVFPSQRELASRNDPIGSVNSSMSDKTSPDIPGGEVHQDGDEMPWKSNFMDQLIYGFEDLSKSIEFHSTHEELEANAKASNPSAATYTDQRSHCLSRSSHRTADMEFRESRRFGIPTAPISTGSLSTKKDSSCVKPNFGQDGTASIQDSKLRHPGDAASTVELLLTDVLLAVPHKTKLSKAFFLHEAFESAVAALSTSSTARCSFNDVMEAKPANPPRTIVFDLVTQRLDSTRSRFLDSGYRSWTKLAVLCTKERLVTQIKNETVRCSSMGGKALEDLVGDDPQHSDEMDVGCLHEAFQIGVQIEADLLQELVSEIQQDLLGY